MTIETGPGTEIRATPKRPSAKEVTEFHTFSDVDGSPKAQHHTLGPGPTQASPGNHSHDGGASAKMTEYASVTHNHDLAYFKANVPWSVFNPSGGWVNYAVGHMPGQFRKVGDEFMMRGKIKHATTSTIGTIAIFGAANRPVGGILTFYCPCAITGSTVGGIARLDMHDDTGVLEIVSYVANASGGWIELSPCRWSCVA